MAKVRKNVYVRGLSGGIGDMVLRQMPNGETYISSKPDFSRRKFSRDQKQHQSRFQQAAAYARRAAKSEPIYAQMAAGTVLSAYNVALSDWFNPPVIHRIERKGGKVSVYASDNVKVTRVEVRILDEEGQVVEVGDAAQVGTDVWEFGSSAEGRVVVKVWDLAGNEVEEEV